MSNVLGEPGLSLLSVLPGKLRNMLTGSFAFTPTFVLTFLPSNYSALLQSTFQDTIPYLYRFGYLD